MNEKLDWSQQSREKQKLMSEALTIAKNAVEKFTANQFSYVDRVRDQIKTELIWKSSVQKFNKGKSKYR